MNAIIGAVKRVIGKGGPRTREREREKGGADWESSLYRQIIGVEAKTGKTDFFFLEAKQFFTRWRKPICNYGKEETNIYFSGKKEFYRMEILGNQTSRSILNVVPRILYVTLLG